MPILIQYLGVDAGLLVAAGLALWLVSLRLKDVSFIDAWWPSGMLLVGAVNLALAPRPGLCALGLFAVAVFWGGRLALYLFRRWRRLGPDGRYEAMLADARTRRGWSFPRASLLLVFALQPPLQWIVALPLEVAPFGGGGASPLAAAGAVLALFGAVFETVADTQLARFKRDPAHRGQVMDQGLWRYSRHPNHFGEACFWWGAYALAAASSPWGVFTLPGPLVITALLTKGSGGPTVEAQMKAKGAAYADYMARTPAFIPWPPKRG